MLKGLEVVGLVSILSPRWLAEVDGGDWKWDFFFQGRLNVCD